MIILCLSKEKVQTRVEDKVLWNEEKEGLFFVKSLVLVPHVYFPANTIWHPKLQPSICFFAWEAAWGKVLTLDQLKKRGRLLANWCFFV